VLNYSTVCIGSIDSVNGATAEIFKLVLLSNASKIYVAHNHPSGIMKPTKEDILMTKNIGSVAHLFGVELLDSLIVGNLGEFCSIRKAIMEGDLNGAGI